MTLNKTWTECLRMWKWIAKVWKEGMSVDDLKIEWMEKHGYGRYQVQMRCFFCQYAFNGDDLSFGGCDSACPGKLVNKRFDCRNSTYHWLHHPKAFYRKLLALNKKRLNR